MIRRNVRISLTMRAMALFGFLLTSRRDTEVVNGSDVLTSYDPHHKQSDPGQVHADTFLNKQVFISSIRGGSIETNGIVRSVLDQL